MPQNVIYLSTLFSNKPITPDKGFHNTALKSGTYFQSFIILFCYYKRWEKDLSIYVLGKDPLTHAKQPHYLSEIWSFLTEASMGALSRESSTLTHGNQPRVPSSFEF